MRINLLKSILKTAVNGATVLLLGAGLAGAQQQVNLTAGPTTATMPDGSSIPMWGYSCGTAVAGSTATCAAANPNAGTGWSPVIITVPTGQDLTINLTNNLPTPPGATTGTPTSLVIVGQLGGGLGDVSQRTTTPSPNHDGQQTTWPIANTGPTFTPPSQGSRIQSFSTEVQAGATTLLPPWTAPRPGTYLLESGTHPSIQATMGLIGMVVVTTAPAGTAGTAYPGVSYNAEVPLIFSEIDPNQNRAVAAAVGTGGFSESATYGTYVGGTVNSITVTNGGKGYTAATVTFSAGSPTTATATAVVDTDPSSPTHGQVTEIDIVNPGSYTVAPTITITGDGTGAQAVPALDLQKNGMAHCSGGAAACYPPVVNYSPLYYLINGAAFNKTNTSASLFHSAPAAGIAPLTGQVLVRLVNAGVRMHVPSIVGSLTGSTTPVGGFSLIAEDGNPLPGIPRVQSEVFMAPGKTYDVMINAPAVGASILTTPRALPIFDRELSLSGNATARDAGMLAYISINGAGAPVAAGATSAVAMPDEYDALVANQTLTVSDPAKGVIANDVNVYGVTLLQGAANGTVTLNRDGTFSYLPSGTATSDRFSYCANGSVTSSGCSSGLTAIVLLKASNITDSGITLCTPEPAACNYTSNLATHLTVKSPGILEGATDGAKLPLTVVVPTSGTITGTGGMIVTPDANGGFTAVAPGPGTWSFTFSATNSLGTTGTGTVSITFPKPNGLTVNVVDGSDRTTPIGDYRWIIEEDRTFFSDPKCTTNPPPAGCPGNSSGIVPNFGTNFHTSYMPVIATGCTGDNSCGAGQTVLGKSAPQQPVTMPGDVALCPAPQTTPPTTNCLDPNKRYYISVLPGDAAQPFIAGYAGAPDCSTAGVAAGSCGHGMGGSPIPTVAATDRKGQTVTVFSVPSPYPPATLSVFVFEDDYPLNGEHDAGGGIDVLSPDEPGLGGFQILLADDAGGTGDSTGQPTYDMFNMPLTNSLAGTIDPITGKDACPISTQVTAASEGGDSSQNGIVGMIVTCPTYESDGSTLSPLAGQAVVKNLYQGRYGVIANPGADRIARGEEWLQTNTLDGQKAHDSFMRIGEPGYFQEFGPAGYHVTIGFANPKIINARRDAMCPSNSTADGCTHEVKGHVTTARMSRTPDERLYGSGDHNSYAFTQCYVSIGDPDGADFGFTKCDADGNYDFKNVPAGNWKVTTFDQWNDQVVDGITTAVGMCTTSGTTTTCNGTDGNGNVDMGEVAVHQWQSNISTRTFLDTDFSGVSTDQKPGLALVATNNRFRDGSFSNFNNTDFNGFAGFNEIFPLFNWYVIETDSTRYKNTGTHVVYDSGGPVDGSSPGGTPCTGLSLPSTGTNSKPCESSAIASSYANTYEPNPLPFDLSVPGAVYCTLGDTADCTGESIAKGPKPFTGTGASSTGRIDPAWVTSYGWQGYSGQNNFIEFGKKPYAVGENGGIHGHVVYASTRPFDDPTLLLQLSWEPLVPHVRINLYQEGLAKDGVTKTLTLVDHTETSSFDDWAQGVRSDGAPNMNCPGQGTDSSNTSLMQDPYFWYALKDQPQWLDLYNNGGVPTQAVKHDSQFKCYDGMHNWNQIQPAPYDGMYSFPSVTSLDPVTGKPTGSNCTGCTTNPTHGNPADPNATVDTTDPNYDPYRAGMPMLPPGKYVVEVVVPPGFELVKEEDKNILIGDNYIAPVTQQFGGLASIFILPDQASVTTGYNANNGQNPTSNLGRTTLPSHEADTGSVETYWPCVGAERTVPDYISLFPGSHEVAPFAGATRNLCDKKEVTLDDQTSALAKFYVFTETHAASHFTGVITDDFTAEFDPFSPQFGEKYGPAYLPISFKDWKGNEIERVYTDAWGAYNGLSYSTWEVNPPNPTGYGPTMMVGCMNDAGPVSDGKGGTITDPLYQDGYSQFCYELPFMPGQTGYFDTPVVPTSAFAGGYNVPDCAYPDATPAVSEVDGDGVGPYVASAGKGYVTGVTVNNNGAGYTTVPSVTFQAAPAGGTRATGTAILSGIVKTVTLNNGGKGYASAPTVSIIGAGGSGATATATMTGNTVFSVTIDAGGSGYNPAPAVHFTGGCTTEPTATATRGAAPTRAVTGVNVTTPGSGCTSAPTVSFTGGGGSGAAATAHIGESIATVTVTSQGSGYSAVPTVSFDPPQTGGTPATATAVMSSSVVGVNVTNPGAGYTSSSVTVTIASAPSGGTNATATAKVNVNTATLTITALGNQNVDNYEYSGPAATAPPFNLQKVSRNYGFGARCTTPASGSSTCNTLSSVTIGGVNAPITSWVDGQITVSIPSGVPSCAIQQQAQYGGSQASCGELVITAGNGKQSVDTVTVTIGGSAPKYVSGNFPLTASGFGSIQNAIDSANPGDLIIVPPGKYTEMLLMWKPVRLQGVGAASSIIDANTQPAGKLNPWRQRVVCLFGLALNGTPISSSNQYADPASGLSCPSNMQFSVDRLPLEATVGWEATLNGNLAEQLAEPTLMGSYEGAGITVLSKGVWFPDPSHAFDSDVFPTGTLLLNGTTNATYGCGPNTTSATNPFPSNFLCNPSSIDGLTVKNSSQGGGGILVHGWSHNLQIANNRVTNNQGTLSGGITVGQGEHPDAYLIGGAATATIPGSCVPDPGTPLNMVLPYCYDMDVNVHNNAVTQNSSLGDELFSSTPAGAGGVTFCNGSDYYKFNYNWVCGNMSTGDGAGVAHIGLTFDGDIEHNSIMFNQSTNPTIVTNGGGLLVMGAPDVDPLCGTVTDKDCVDVNNPGSILPSDGTGPGLVINANLLLGNSADSGSGGGLRLQHVNGTEVLNFPNGAPTTNRGAPATVPWPVIPGHPAQPSFQTSTPWNAVNVTNNIIANNVAGWDGGGVSLQDALAVNLVNNTITSNNSTASSGVLFQTLFAPLASTQGVNCTSTSGGNSCPQPAGLVSVTNSAVLKANISQITPGGTSAITCPADHGTRGSTTGPDCTINSVPALYNDLIWQNRSLIIGVGNQAAGFTNQQSTVSVLDPVFVGTGTPPAAAKQASTGSCDDTNVKYWEIGVRGDTAPSNHSGGRLAPSYSVLTDASDYLGAHNTGTDPSIAQLYCDGSRVPVEISTTAQEFPGWQTPPGTNESNALPAPPFTLAAAATVDEGNNWINLRWGPLSLNVLVPGSTTGAGNTVFTFNPSPTTGSSATGLTPSSAGDAYTDAPSSDFFGIVNRKANNAVDAGAIELPPPSVPTLSSIAPNSGALGRTVSVTLTGTSLAGTSAITVSGTRVTVSAITVVNNTTVTATFTIASNAATGARTVTVTTPGGTSGSVNFTITTPPPAILTSITPNAGNRGASVPVTLTGSNFTGATGVTAGTGITVSNFTVVSDTSITATFAISGTTTTGTRNVSVTSPFGNSGNVTFTINNPPAPTLTSIAPNSGVKNSAVTYTLTGTNLTATSAVTVSGSGVTSSAITVVNPTTVTVTLTISNAVATTTGTRTVTVTTPGGTSNTVQFTVNPRPPAPTLTSISPNSGTHGTTVAVTLTGANFTGATSVDVSGALVNVTSYTVMNSTTITANIQIGNLALRNAKQVTVTTPGGTSGSVTFTVN